MISVGNMTYKMLFLRGIEKSGTTWLVNTLNLHPQINIAKKEIHFQFLHDAFYSQFSSPVFHGGLPHVKPVVDKLFKQIVSEVQHKFYMQITFLSDVPLYSLLTFQVMLTVRPEKPGALYLGEKTPGPILPLMPDSPHIAILRDGRDVLISFFYHFINKGSCLTPCPCSATSETSWHSF